MASKINPISNLLYRLARWSRNLRSVEKSVQQGSVTPIFKRIWNVWIVKNTFRAIRRAILK